MFRDTGLDDQGHIRFSYQLGDLEKRPIFREDDPGRFKHPELFEIGNVDKDGNVYEAAVDETRELVDMMETARAYQNNVEVMNTAKSLVTDTLKMGR